MGKKPLAALLLGGAAALLAGCSAAPVYSTPSLPSPASSAAGEGRAPEPAYTVTLSYVTQDKIHIHYPRISGLDDPALEQKINDRGLDVETNIPDDPTMVQGDRDLITQVIYNLLENAAKFATPHTALYLGLATNDEKAIISVRNHGATIAPEEIPLLFERFHKSDKSRSEDKDGYGLGLYVVKTILAQHKEHISVTSENGLTSFDFTLQLTSPHNT